MARVFKFIDVPFHGYKPLLGSYFHFSVTDKYKAREQITRSAIALDHLETESESIYCVYIVYFMGVGYVSSGKLR